MAVGGPPRLIDPRRLPPDLAAIPPGLIREAAAWAYRSSPRPSTTTAIAEAIAAISAAAGAGYTLDGDHLAAWIARLARQECALEPIGRAAQALITAVATLDPAARMLIGPCAANVHRTRAPCLTVAPFLGASLQKRTHARASEKRRALAELRSAPVTILGASDPALWRRTHEGDWAEGSLAHIIGLEHADKPPRPRRAPDLPPPADLVAALGVLAATARAQTQAPIRVETSWRALPIIAAYAQEVAQACAAGDIRADILQHAVAKARRLAALAAVARDPFSPVIGAAGARWAIDLVRCDTEAMITAARPRERRARVVDEAAQIALVREKVRDFQRLPIMSIQPSCQRQITEKERDVGLIPLAFLRTRLKDLAPFRRDPAGATAAVRRTAYRLVERGELSEADEKTRQAHGRAGLCFQVV